MFALLLLSFAVALAAPWLYRYGRHATGWLLALLPLGLFGYFVGQLPVVLAGEAVRQVVPWVPSFGVNLSFYLDGLSLLFALLITGFGALILPYASSYLRDDAHLGRFYLSLLLFMGAMLGVVLSDNLVALFVFWELTSFSSYLLIGYKHQYESTRQSALQALLVTGMGGLALLGGFLLLGIAAGGTFALQDIMTQGEAIRGHALYSAIFALIVLGAFTKSAQFPFHFWLPNAMAAPTPVSAYLHSATMVKAGIYLLARMDSLLGGTALWVWVLSLAGAATMVVGAVLALRHTDLKKVLAYSTITALGTLTLLLGLSFEASIKAAMVFLVVHALYKGALFLVAGSVDHETGTRDVLRLGGLRRTMPLTATAALLAGLSMAGLPPLFGFVGKELAYKAKLSFEGMDVLLPGVAVLANALTVVAAGIIVLRPFFGPVRETPKVAHEPPARMWVGPLVLSALGLAFGLLPTVFAAPLVGAAVTATLGSTIPIKLSLWYGFNLALLLSVATFAAGIAVYLVWDRVQPRLAKTCDALAQIGPERGYQAALNGLVALAKGQTNLIQGGTLTRHLTLLIVVLVGGTGWTFLQAGPPDWLAVALADLATVPWKAAILAGLVVLGMGYVLLTRSRMGGVMALGVVGFSIALLFLRLGAPDVAMTQFLVETLVVLILLLVIAQLPRFERTAPPEPRSTRWSHGLLATAGGVLMTGLALAIAQTPLDGSVSNYFAQESVPSGYGRNIVNVILVDFRALDTLGEIVVLAVAALGAYVLVSYGLLPPLPRFEANGSLILRTATRFMMTLLLLASLFLLWRGHNEPGGGFIGGLVAAGAFALYLMAFGQYALRQLLRIHPRTLLGIGLGLAVVSGLFAVVTHDAFMTGQWITLTLGNGNVLKLGTPLLFDVGVYLVVIGFTLTIILALERAAQQGETARARGSVPTPA